MPSPAELWRRLLFFLGRNRLDRELQEEMRQHLEFKAQENLDFGMSQEEAGHEAARQFGNALLLKEKSRKARGFAALETITQDLRYGLRMLRKAPGFTAVAIITLALGIGVNTAIFSVVNTILLRPLPYRDSARIVHLWTTLPEFPNMHLTESASDFPVIRDGMQSFESMAAYREAKMNLTGRGEPEQLSSAIVSAEFLPLLGIQTIQGRTFDSHDEHGSNGKVVLLSYALWQRRFGGDAGILGKGIILNQQPYTVVGILPRGFSFPNQTDILTPLSSVPEEQGHDVFVLAKLRPGVPLQKAQSELDTIAARLSKNHPDDDSGRKLEAVLLQTEVTGNARSMLLVLVGAVGLLLLMACVNVSNLILSRGLQRQREIATRTALGASRSRIVRQLLAESLLLSFLGGVLGLLLAIWGVDIFRVLAPAGIPRIDELRIEPSLVWVALAISSLAGILSGLAPALHTARPDLNLALKERQSSAPATASRFPLRSFLIVSEVALALILLTGSGLMMQSLLRLLHVNSGIRTDHLLTMDLTLPQARYPGDNHLVLFAQRLMESLQQHPGIENVAITNSTLFRGSMHIAPVIIPGVTNERDIGNQAQEKSVTPDYFRCLGIHVVSGRTFSDRDVQGITRVAVINESLARRYWGSQSPLGKNVILGPNPEDSVQIIGVVADTRDTSLRVGPQPQVYVAFFQGSGAFSQKSSAGIHLLIRTASDPAALISDVRRQIWSQDKDLPITKVQTMAEAISESVSERRFQSLLLGAFAGLGLVLTLVGIYGVISYSVSQRTREIGIRLALGAQRGNVLQYVLREGAQLALLGVVTGLAGSLLAMRLLANQLFGIKATDPATLIFAALLMLAVALAASYIPARRATKVDPMIALRYE